MNRIHRSIHNETRGTSVAVPETAKAGGHGKRQRARLLAPATAALAATVILGLPAEAQATCDVANTTCSGTGVHTITTGNGFTNAGTSWTFDDQSTLEAGTPNAITAGTQTFNDDSTLQATSSNAITGGTQTFNDNSVLEATIVNAITGGTQVLNDNSTLLIGAENALSSGTSVEFGTGSTAASGTLDLNGHNSWVGKITSSNGAGIIQNSGSTAATLHVNGSDNSDFSGVIQDGNGALRLQITLNGHQATLTGQNTYSGGTRLSYGILYATSESLGSGDIQIDQNGSLRLDQSFDGTLSNRILPGSVGTGGLMKLGTGVIELTGDNSSNPFRGNTVIDGGGLIIGANTHVGNTNVRSGATLGGTGFVTQLTVENGGFVSPGLGQLTVKDLDAVLSAGSTYIVTANNTTASNIRTDTGSVFINDADLDIQAQGSTWNYTQTYTIVSANHQVTGQFDNITSNFAFLDPTLAYGNNTVSLTLTRNDGLGGTGGGFASQATTSNQRNLANAVDSLPQSNDVHQYVATLPQGAPAAAFDSLSGEAHASIAGNLSRIAADAGALPLQNLRTSLNAGLQPGAPTAQVGNAHLPASALPSSSAKPAWVGLIGNWQNLKGDRNTATLRQHSTGIFAGYDQEIANGWYVGGALGFTDTRAKVSSRDSKADIQSYSATAYGGKAFELSAQRRINLSGGVAYTYHDIDSQREVAGLGQKLKASYGAHTVQAFGEAGYLIGQPDSQYVEPFAGLTVSNVRSNSFREKGGTAALKGKSDSNTQAISTLGVRAQTRVDLGNSQATLQGTLGWQHAFGSERQRRTLAFRDGGQAFNVSGVAVAQDTALLGLGAKVALQPGVDLSLDLQGEYGSGLREHSAAVKVNWVF